MKEEFDEEKLLEALKIAEEMSQSHLEGISESLNAADLSNEKTDQKPDADEVMHSLMSELLAETQAEAAAEGINAETVRDNFFQAKQEKKQEKKQANVTEPKRPVNAPKKLKNPWSKKKKAIVWMLCALLVLFGIPATVIYGFAMQGKKQLRQNAGSEVISFHEDGSPSTSVTYNGENYVYDDDCVSILVFGVDNQTYEKPEEQTEIGQDGSTSEAQDTRDRDDELTYTDASGTEYVQYGGRVDMCFLVVFRKSTKKVSVVNINRDSMTDVDIRTIQGETALTARMQLGLAYGYGDGGTVSCRNLATAVSGMLYDLPIHGYVALDMTAMGDINDAVRGVTVAAKDTVNENVFAKDVVLLQGEDAYAYLEKMDTGVEEIGAHAKRMKRQSQYVAAWLERLLQCYQSDKHVIEDIYEATKPYMQTNLGKQELLYLTLQMWGAQLPMEESEIKELPGNYVRTTYFDEYELDREQLEQLLIETFYIKKD